MNLKLKNGVFEPALLKEEIDGNEITRRVIVLKCGESGSHHGEIPPTAFLDTGKKPQMSGTGKFATYLYSFYELLWKEEDQYYMRKNVPNGFVTVKMSSAENEMALNEIGILQQVGNTHPNIIHCVEALKVGNEVFLITQFMQEASLFSFDDEKMSFSALEESLAHHIFDRLLSVVAHLRARGLSHSGITAENIKLSAAGDLLLADFQNSFQFSLAEESRHLINRTNDPYMPPETANSDSKVDASNIDVWAVCVVLFVMLTGVLPGNEPNTPTIARAAVHSPALIEEMLRSLEPNTLVQDLLRRVFQKEAPERLSLEEIRSHPWVAGKMVGAKNFLLKSANVTTPSVVNERRQRNQSLGPYIPPTEQLNMARPNVMQTLVLQKEIQDCDIVLGDAKSKKHPGNLLWKGEIRRYIGLEPEMAMRASENIVEQIQNDHGRFLMKHSLPGLWFELLTDEATMKTFTKLQKGSNSRSESSPEQFLSRKQKYRRSAYSDGSDEQKRHRTDDVFLRQKSKTTDRSMSWNSSSSSMLSSEITTSEIHDNDVLFGGIGKVNPHPGNVYWKECCNERAHFLSDIANFKAYGENAAKEICEKVWNLSPPGRFLESEKQSSGLWNVLPNKDAVQKTLQMFRVGAAAALWPDQYNPFVVVADAARCTPAKINGGIENAWLMRQHDPKYAYNRIEGRAQTDVERRGKKLGDMTICTIYSRDWSNSDTKMYSFVDQQDRDLLVVTVKRFDRSAVTKYLAAEAIDDPILEFDTSKILDDDRYVLNHEEILKDEKNIYIVEPYCNGGSMLVAVEVQPMGWMTEILARGYFRQIIMCLNHLQKSGICHRSLSPENILIRNTRCVISNFGQALRVPFTFDGKRQLAQAMAPPTADLSFMAPEIFRSENFDGYATDLWSGMCVLYFMLTGLVLYKRPDDELYNYFVKEGLLWLRPRMEDSSDILSRVLEDTNDNAKAEVVNMIRERETAHERLSDRVMDLFGRCLHDDPMERMTLADVCYHDWSVERT